MATTGPNELAKYQIGKDKYVVVSKFNGEVLTHIRQYGRSWDGVRMYPTLKGIVLRPVGFANLVAMKDEICDALQNCMGDVKVNLHKHIARGIYVSVSCEFPVVNLRTYFLPTRENEPKPTQRGICLSIKEWVSFISVIDFLRADVKELKEAVSSICRGDEHSNQMAFYDCAYCNPFNLKPE